MGDYLEGVGRFSVDALALILFAQRARNAGLNGHERLSFDKRSVIYSRDFVHGADYMGPRERYNIKQPNDRSRR